MGEATGVGFEEGKAVGVGLIVAFGVGAEEAFGVALSVISTGSLGITSAKTSGLGSLMCEGSGSEEAASGDGVRLLSPSPTSGEIAAGVLNAKNPTTKPAMTLTEALTSPIIRCMYLYSIS